MIHERLKKKVESRQQSVTVNRVMLSTVQFEVMTTNLPV
jgi:hypothetical protein